VKLARLRRPKTVCSPSYMDCKTKTSAAIMGHNIAVQGRNMARHGNQIFE
jgi:hypothetical protein